MGKIRCCDPPQFDELPLLVDQSGFGVGLTDATALIGKIRGSSLLKSLALPPSRSLHPEHRTQGTEFRN